MDIKDAVNQLRVTNRQKVLFYLLKEKCASRVELAGELNLTKAAVTLLVGDMIQEGILLEQGEVDVLKDKKRARGRRRIGVAINKNYKLSFGAAIERDKLLIGLTNLQGEVLDKRIVDFEDNIEYRTILELIVENIENLIRENYITNDNIIGLGVAVSKGAMDYVYSGSDKTTKIKKDLSHALSMKIASSETLAGGLIAECLFGVQRKLLNMFLVRYGKEKNSAIFINGNIYRGANLGAGGFACLLKNNDKEDETSKVTDAIINMNCVLDSAAIGLMGEYFETEENFDKVKNGIKEHCKAEVFKSILKNDNLFLAGNALAVNEFFYKNAFL